MMEEKTLRLVLDQCARGDYGAAIQTLEQYLQAGEASSDLVATMARVAALAGDQERVSRAALWLSQRKGQIEPEAAAEGFYWRGDLVTARRTLEAARPEHHKRPEWLYLMALVHYREGRPREAYTTLLEFARAREQASEESETLEEALALLAEGSLEEDELEDWRMILGDCETEVAEGRPMGLRLARLSEEIEKAVWGSDPDRQKVFFDKAARRLSRHLGVEKTFRPQQAEEVLLPFVQLVKVALVEEELEQSWQRRDWGEVCEHFLQFFMGRLREQRDRLGMGDVDIEKQDVLSLSRSLPLGMLRPLVYLTTLARFPDHEVVERIFAERGEEVLVLIAMSVLSLATFLGLRPLAAEPRADAAPGEGQA
ncbi:MAG: hypothetical protein ONB23_08315 [candidate division KSB1 bacterium]|nr:hypothetical protein [candidate division KSB1 bacterium]